jgi:hypothetical protein
MITLQLSFEMDEFLKIWKPPPPNRCKTPQKWVLKKLGLEGEFEIRVKAPCQ